MGELIYALHSFASQYPCLHIKPQTRILEWFSNLPILNSQISPQLNYKKKSLSESDHFAGASEGKAQIKRFKLFTSCHSEETEETSTADNRAEAPAGLRTLASCK